MISVEYIILLILLLISLFKQSKILIYLSIFFMLLLAVCRDITVGTDFLGYFEDFQIIHNPEHDKDIIYHSFEIGFIYLIYLFKKITTDYLLFGSLIYLPFFFGCLKFMKESNINIAYGLFVFYTYGFYFSGYNIMRQMMCIGLILSFIGLLYKCKYKCFAAIVIAFSLLFHRSSIIFLFLIPIHYYATKIDIVNKKVLYIMVILSYCVYYVGANFFLGIFSTFTSTLGLSDYSAGYLRTDSEGGNTVSLMYTFLTLLIIYCKSPHKGKFQILTFVFSIVIYNLLNIIPTYASRAVWGLMAFSMVLIPQMLMDKNTLHKKLFFPAVIIFGLGYFFYAYYMNNFGEINPYIWRS